MSEELLNGSQLALVEVPLQQVTFEERVRMGHEFVVFPTYEGDSHEGSRRQTYIERSSFFGNDGSGRIQPTRSREEQLRVRNRLEEVRRELKQLAHGA